MVAHREMVTNSEMVTDHKYYKMMLEINNG